MELSLSVIDPIVGVDESSLGGGLVVDMWVGPVEKSGMKRGEYSKIIGLVEVGVCVEEGEPTGTNNGQTTPQNNDNK